MLIPYTNSNNGYIGYSNARGGVGTDSDGFKTGGTGLAIDRAALAATRLNAVSNQPVNRYSVHPRLPFLKTQFDSEILLLSLMWFLDRANNNRQLSTRQCRITIRSVFSS